jgi:HrpA-like RNA helicase
MADQQTPELLRLSLQDLAIRVKICKLGGIEETLGQALDPPSAKNIRRAIDALIDVRALTPGEDLTALGTQLAKLPLDVFLGKLILMGSLFKCLDAVITIAAILSSKSPFSAPFGARAQADTVRLAFRRGKTIFHSSSPGGIEKWLIKLRGFGSSYCLQRLLGVETCLHNWRLGVSILQKEFPQPANLVEHRGSQGAACCLFSRRWFPSSDRG